MGAYETNSIDQFLKHKANAGGAGFLKKWTDRNPPEINVFLHTKRLPVVLWQHPFPKVMIREDKETRKVTKEIWGGTYTCREDESILSKQYHRNDDGTRKYAPVKCPMCRLVELIRDLVEEDKMDWLTKVFRFEGDKDNRIIHAGGIFGLFKSDDLTDEELRQLKDAGLKRNEVYQENCYSKCNYVFCVVDADNVQDGVQIATVTNLLGDKIKEVMNDKLKSDGVEAGNPFLNPYCIQWEFLKQEQDIKKKYKARPMTRIGLTPAIRQLITSDPPDLSNVVAPFELKTMRAYLERHCLINDKIDWDYVFDVVVDPEEEKNAKAVGELKGSEADPHVDAPAGASAPADDEDKCPECGKTEDQGCPHAMCDCGKIILADAPKCQHCGKVFIAEPPPPPPPTTGRKRRGARAAGGGTDSGEVPPFAK